MPAWPRRRARLPAYKPTKRGGGGTLKLLWWQGPVHLNPQWATGTKEQEGSRMFYEPLAAWDNDGNLFPVLAAEVPSTQNGSVSADGKVVTWKLKQGVTWHDGQPFTADDVVFNWEFIKDPATASSLISVYKDIKVEKVDSHTVRITFPKPTPFWAEPFVGTNGMIIPKHLFAAYMGAKSREAPMNMAPVGTGPYKFVDFKPGDMVRGTLNPNYHQPNRPYFDAIEMKGGGDAIGAARAVLQTGEYDYAWNLQVEDEILKRLEASGKGKVNIVAGGNIEFIQLNPTDPWTEVDGERASIKSKHPAFQDKAVREAMGLLVDRKSVQDFIYGRTGVATANFLNNPERFRSKATKFEFNIDKANQVLEAAGWKKGADGIRAKGNVKLKFVYQTSVNQPRQKTQAIVKDACTKAGIDLELKSVTAAVFFGGDFANPDTYQKFWSRHPDVHDHDDPARPADLHGAVLLLGAGAEGQQMGQAQHLALAQRRIRQAAHRRARRDGPGQARGDVHQDERTGDRRRQHHPGGVPPAAVGGHAEAGGAAVRLGQRHVGPAPLVQGSLTPQPTAR